MAQPWKRKTNVDDQGNSEFIGLHLYCMFDYTCEHHCGKKQKVGKMHYGPSKQWYRSVRKQWELSV